MELETGKKYWFITNQYFIFGEIKNISDNIIKLEKAFLSKIDHSDVIHGFKLVNVTLYKNQIVAFCEDKNSASMSTHNVID